GMLSERWVDDEVAGHGWRGYAAFIAVGTLATALGFPRQVIAFLGGYAFGVLLGTELALAGTVIGCAATFVFARVVVGPSLRERLARRVGRLDEFLGAAPFQMSLVIRLLPVGSNVLTNVFAGIARVRFAPFASGSAVGYLPQTVAFALAGSGVQLGRLLNVGLAGILLVVSALLGIRLYRQHRHGAALEAEIDNSLGDGRDTGSAPAA
ncbi:MAG: VTT domain-containing protein, partial [Betaproteobacteria bacterium]|nr:VTT domain-containing protein [Betaproteobacteria bacterium]